MTKFGKKHQKQLAKLVAAALICAGGGLFSPPSVASASEVTVTNVTAQGTGFAVTSTPAEGMSGSGSFFYPTSANVLNITGTFNATTSLLYGGIRFFGGYSADGTVSGKTVNINGTDIAVHSIAGGFVANGVSVTGNHVNFLGGTTGAQNIYGGFGPGNGSKVSDNHVTIAEGSTVKYGDGNYGTAIVGGAGNGDIDANTVTISGTLTSADKSNSNYLHILGGDTYGDGTNATGNSVTISGATLNTGAIDGLVIIGGAAKNSIDDLTGDILTTSGNATGNNVTISGNSTFGEGSWEIYGGKSDSGTANDNTVEISGGTIKGRIYGGSGSTEASGNTVTISGVANLAATTMIYGGMAMNGEANDNTVNILTAINVDHILGGEGATSTGNTLNIAATGVTVGDDGVVGFQNMNFFLPEGSAGQTMLTVNAKDAYGNGTATDLKGVTIGAAVQAGANFNKGDTVNLITNPSGLTTDGTTTMKQITDETVTIQTTPTAKTLTTDQSYKLEVSQKDENTIVATVTDKEEKQNSDRAKSLVETRAATTTFVNAGADMLASQGFMQAANAVALDAAEAAKNGTGAQNVGGFTPFAAIGGSSMRAESGSYVNTKGFGLNVGFARELPNAQGKLLFGPVIEYGGGSYDSHLDDGTRGEGKAHYVGVGVMARQVNNDGFYYEGSLRGGRVTSDYKGDLDSIGRVDYDSSSNYFAAHLGVGKAFALGNGNTLDGYCKYFYSHQAGDDTTVHIAGMADERGHFDTVDSHRIRIGARLTHKVNERNSYYGGLAYQYEFKGDARATFSGNGVPSPSIKGSSGMLELGWQVKPGEGPLHLDLGVTGWAGKQRGGNVQLGATWTF
ncbi:autotransporter outer membrane beta-barrel domain-containing protein [Selenomonas ruminis]|uniref:Autotransporter outer membrane beta-barrel domain-containing protein n=1 Tax=Selenomonas ruminis TaxID=2593411 RepID=A0A5D6W2V8_9FIRM|nr:autotransporter outer membrane beta-barrel domain-containing protein [Selenomonas sp. mPRGC5]TYZ22246.1 autotransporter outer membrane beta-barrel domain-containing protein [Selenomonas sp. mPRGC5]